MIYPVCMVSYTYMIAVFAAVLAFADIALTLLSQIALWQRKEYRIDRMMAYLDSPEGSLTKQKNTLLLTIFVATAWGALSVGAQQLSEILAFAGIILHFIGHGFRIVRKGIIRPEITARVQLIATLGICLIILWIAAGLLGNTLFAITWATTIFIIPLIAAICVALSSIPVSLKKKSVINRARTYRQTLKNLTVIGITGSVGKTSTKTYLLHLLSGPSERVRATDKNHNSPYPVAKDILASLTQKTIFYIAEMAAYRKGEIAELALLTKPDIGVITAITNQHVALFGSLQNLASAKWELIDALPDDGIAVLNADDDQIAQKAKSFKKKIVWYSLKKPNNFLDHILVLGNGQRSSALAAATVAQALGVSEDEIIARLSTLPAIPRTMELKKGMMNSRVIDDSYSASEASVMNAIEYLASLDEKDIRLVLVPIIELGKEASRVHQKIGKNIAPLSARVFIYGDAYREDIKKGLGKHPVADVVWISNPNMLAEKVSEDITKETTILLEGRVPSIVRKRLL